MAEPMPAAGIWGLLAEFASPQELLDAVRQTKAAGYTAIDAFTPFPVEELSEEIEDHRQSKVSPIVLIGGLTGATVAFLMQYWISVIDYPLNIGGRPLYSWPAFIPVTFELMVLFAAFSAVIGMFALNGLPKPHHPLFGVKRFEHATQDAYFLVIESRDPRFDPIDTRGFLATVGATEVIDVAP